MSKIEDYTSSSDKECPECHRLMGSTTSITKDILFLLNFSDLDDQDLSNCKICKDCIKTLSKQNTLRLDRANVLLTNLLQEGALDKSQEKQSENKCQIMEKSLNDSIKTYSQHYDNMTKERNILYQDILKEINEMFDLEDEFTELEYQNSSLRDDLEKLNTELSIEELKDQWLEDLYPFEKVFEIKLYEEYGNIRQYDIRFPPKPNFSSPQHWIRVNEGIGAILWLLSSLFEVINLKKKECEIFVMGPASQIKHQEKILLMYGPFEDVQHQKGFNQGIIAISLMSLALCEEIGKKVKPQQNSLTFEAKLPNKVDKGEVGKVPLEFNTQNVRRWELAIRNILENLAYILKLYSKLK